LKKSTTLKAKKQLSGLTPPLSQKDKAAKKLNERQASQVLADTKIPTP
jgi:hypothetical protein